MICPFQTFFKSLFVLGNHFQSIDLASSNIFLNSYLSQVIIFRALIWPLSAFFKSLFVLSNHFQSIDLNIFHPGASLSTSVPFKERNLQQFSKDCKRGKQRKKKMRDRISYRFAIWQTKHETKIFLLVLTFASEHSSMWFKSFIETNLNSKALQSWPLLSGQNGAG